MTRHDLFISEVVAHRWRPTGEFVAIAIKLPLCRRNALSVSQKSPVATSQCLALNAGDPAKIVGTDRRQDAPKYKSP